MSDKSAEVGVVAKAADVAKAYAAPVGKALLAIGIVAGAAFAGYRYGVAGAAKDVGQEVPSVTL